MNIFLFILAVSIVQTTGITMKIEAEQYADIQGFGPRIIPRSNASNKSNVHLFHGDTLEIYFCLPEDDFVSIDDIAFSNDGGADNVTIGLDGNPIAILQTCGQWARGMYWNVLASSGAVGESQELPSGVHTISVYDSGDKWGVEIDCIILKLKNISDNSSIICSEDELIENGSVKKRGNGVNTEPSDQVFAESTNEDFVETGYRPLIKRNKAKVMPNEDSESDSKESGEI